MNQTITAQLNRLPEPYRTQALYNHEHHPFPPKAMEKAPKITMPSQAIMWGFMHFQTSEGGHYWRQAAQRFDYHYFNRHVMPDDGFIVSDLTNSTNAQKP
jgi:hypothetical protein